MDEREAAAYLESLIDIEKRPDVPYERLGLEPVRRLLARVGDPQQALSVVHVAGSKGKGSTALLTEAVLRAAGERVGTFTSPHLERWTERFRIDGREVRGNRLGEAVARLRPHIDALRAEDPATAPTFFDATTAAALLLFRDAGVDRAVLEVGLGGRLDSTNVIDAPAVVCITSIELEHTDKLGGTLAAIAGEKAGVLKTGAPAVVGELPDEARAVVAQRAAELGVAPAWLGRDFGVACQPQADGLRLRLWDGPLAVETQLPLLGAHQAANAALALACVRRAAGLPDAGLADAAARGLAGAVLPGRVELLSRAPWIVVDAAHTGASARALARALAPVPRRRTRLVLSISGGKDVRAILAALLPGASEVTLTRAEPARSLDPAEIADAARSVAPGVALRIVPNPHLALRAAADGLAPDDLLCATGSVYLAGIARRVLGARRPAEDVRVSRRGGRSAVVDP